MCTEHTTGYKKGSHKGGYHPCYAWDIIGWTTTPGKYISPTYYCPTEWGKDNWGKKLRDKIHPKKVTSTHNYHPL
jgi:hypothetical protein